MSSMNLYEFSQVNNEELGMIAWMRDGRTEFKDLLYEAIRLINLSVKQYGKWDIEDIDKPIRRIIRKEPLFIPVDHLAEEDVQERIICHCIRCGRSVPSDHPYPYCGRCLESWKQYMNLNYTEPDGHCYICGNACRASAERPACSGCYGKNAKLVDEKCESMRRLASDKEPNERRSTIRIVFNTGTPTPAKMRFDDNGTAQYSTESATITVSDAGPFGFKRPIPFRIERTENGIILGNTEADLFAFGRTLDEALEDLGSEIWMAWKEYATGDEYGMDGIARGYRGWLLDNVEMRHR